MIARNILFFYDYNFQTPALAITNTALCISGYKSNDVYEVLYSLIDVISNTSNHKNSTEVLDSQEKQHTFPLVEIYGKT